MSTEYEIEENEQRLRQAHAVGSIAGTVACIAAMIDAKTEPPLGRLGGQLAQGLFDVIEQDADASPDVRNAGMKGYCDGIQNTMMEQLVPGTQPRMISGDIELPDTPEMRELLAKLASLRGGQ